MSYLSMDGILLFAVNVAGCAVGGVVGVVFASVAWRNRDVSAAGSYGLLSLSVAAWGFVYAVLLLSSTDIVAVTTSQLARIVSGFVPPLWLLFAANYTGNDRLTSRRALAAIWAIPVAYAVISLTAPLHGAVVYDVVFVTQNGITAPVDQLGPVFWAFIGYSYLLVTAGFLLLVRFLLRSRNIYRKQTATIVIGSLFPVVGNVAVLAGQVPHPAFDITPVLFALNGAIVGWALFRYDFMEVTPVATDTLVEKLPDPVFVLDENSVIREYNDAAAAASAVSGLIGTTVTEAVPELDSADSDEEIVIDREDYRVYAPQSTPIEDHHGVVRGQLLVLRDITIQQRQLNRIEALHGTTQTFLEATSRHGVLRAAMDFVGDELDSPFGVVYWRSGETFTPHVTTDSASDRGVEIPTLDADSPLMAGFETGDLTRIDSSETGIDDTRCDTLVVAPLGTDGLLVVGAAGENTAQFVRILQGTTQAALSRVRREAELRESREEINRRTEQIEFFTGVLRHNIRNGLQVIRGQAAQLRATRADTEPLDRIVEWADELDELTDEVRLVTDFVTSSAEEQRRPTAIDEVLGERIDALERDHGVSVVQSIGDPPPVLANDLVDTVIDSILENTVEHNDSDDPFVSVSVETSSGVVLIRIADDGPGIDDDLKRSVFERNINTRQTAQGFGLYFVAVMMDLFGGDIWFKDRTATAASADGGDRGVTDGGTVAVLQFRRADERKD